MENANNQIFNLSKKDILCKLKNKYKGQYKIFNTYLDQDATRWHRGKKYKFQQSLVADRLFYFAYIKFYIYNDNEYALVAGKSGSYTVNSSGCDLGFYQYPPQKGHAKEWLFRNNMKWCQTEILIIRTIAEEKKASEKEAFAIERYLVNNLGLWES